MTRWRSRRRMRSRDWRKIGLSDPRTFIFHGESASFGDEGVESTFHSPSACVLSSIIIERRGLSTDASHFCRLSGLAKRRKVDQTYPSFPFVSCFDEAPSIEHRAAPNLQFAIHSLRLRRCFQLPYRGFIFCIFRLFVCSTGASRVGMHR